MEPIDLRVKTEHYEFKLTISYDPAIHTVTFLVGDETNPCLQVLINIPAQPGDVKNERFRDMFDSSSHMATLSHVKGLTECARNEITENYLASHSFGLELIQAAVFLIGKLFPFVKKIRLNDSSHIPCGGHAFNDTVDLLIYSIALYGKTWYEKKFNAYIDYPTIYARYKDQIANYTSKEMKNSITFLSIANLIQSRGSNYAKLQLRSQYDTWRHMFETSDTLPAFFIQLMSTIPRNEKCKFLKGWIEPFIDSKVTIFRDWVFDMPSQHQTTAQGRRGRKTRKRRKM